MFRKIVSNISFSPALVGQLSFYANRLRKEQLTRRLGLIFTVMALVVQSLAVFSPPEAANAASPADFIPGGIDNKAQLLQHYDNNTNRIKGLFTALGITRAELAAATRGSIKKAEVPGKYNWSRTSLYSAADGQRSYTFHNGAGDVTFFYRPLRLTQEGSLPYPVLEGHSAKFGWFAIKLDCGNLITNKTLPPPQYCPYNPAILVDNPSCTPPPKKQTPMCTIPGKESLPADSPDCKETPKCTIPGKESLPANSPDCKPNPVAVCSSLDATVADKTLVSLSGNASASNGATVSKYTFTVKDQSGAIIKTIVVPSNGMSVSAPTFELKTPGTYSVTLSVTTSVGEKTDTTHCAKTFTIAPPDMCTYNPNILASSPDCQPCNETSTLWIKDKDCRADIIQTKIAKNMTQGGTDASKVVANPGDKISYTITSENRGQADKTVTMTEELHDVLQYSKLMDSGGGTFKETADAKSLSWVDVSIAHGQKQSRTFMVQVLNPIPTTNTGTSDGSSFDCTMTNTYGNTVNVHVQCPVEKAVVEQTVNSLPHTGPTENMIFAGSVLAVVVYFYARSHQLGTEVRLIRRDVHAGTI